jgi:C1A family cysteine protease
MTKTSSLLTITIIILGLCCSSSVAQSTLELEAFFQIFKDWTNKNIKQYGVEEMAIRFSNWKSNYNLVQEHNSKNLSYQLEMNDFADMTPEEFSALHLGLNVDSAALKNKKAESTNQTEDTLLNYRRLPRSIDWRKKGAVTYVKNQGKCGGCWSFSASGALEGLHAIKKKELVSLSEQQMLDCSSSYGNQGCNGGLMTNAFTYTRDYGLQAEIHYKYVATEETCKFNPQKMVFKNTGLREVPTNNYKALKAAVAKQPVSIGIEASSLAVQLYGGGVITDGCSTNLDHGILIVGYDVTRDGQEYWIVKNSWGPRWGKNGYFHVAMGSQNEGAGVCGINMMASYPTL